jgi:hypothetical protein
MKRCPTCQKTFDDAMRFCQTDGTPLVEAAEPVDPYKTMVASKDDIAAALSSPTGTSPDSSAEEEPLQLPSEPSKEMSDAGSGQGRSDDAQVIEIPPLAEETPPGPPAFSEPSLSPPSFGDSSPPPSPFSATGTSADDASERPTVHQTTPPIPSPFAEPKRAEFERQPQSTPQFAQAEPSTPAFDPFEPQASTADTAVAQAEWTPPPAPDSSWQNQPIGQNTPFQPPPAGAGGENKTLAIVSLVLGVLSLFCCSWFVFGLAAVITGFIARSKANSQPSIYGGGGLATAGIIIGVLSMILGAVFWVLYFMGFLVGLIPNM